ncbi:MAG: 50S ribosomal protein L25 [bacterium]|nr:50S ribosomal protein L25 [bacterium]
MEQVRITATPRRNETKRANKRLRRGGRVPAVVYGGQNTHPRMVTVDNHELELILRGAHRSNAIFKLVLDDGEEQTIIRDIQRHPVDESIIHVDFLRVNLAEEIVVTVTVRAIGETPRGVRVGGILEHVTRNLQVRCLPLNMPRAIEVDLSELDINHSVFVRDLKLPENVTVLDDPDTPLFVILPPKLEAEAPAEGAEAPAEPEVIGKREEKEEEEE